MSNSEMHHRKGSDCKYCKAREIRIRELEELDSRWRPMRTAPRDGTVVELLGDDDCSNFGLWDNSGIAVPEGSAFWWVDVDGDHLDLNMIAWRPAHPEWNEDTDES